MNGIKGWVRGLLDLVLGLGTLVAGSILLATVVIAAMQGKAQIAMVCAFGAYAGINRAHFHLMKWMKF